MQSTDSTLFEDAIDVPLWLETDDDKPYAERARRDREIAKALPARATRDTQSLVRGWWLSLSPVRVARAGARIDRLRGLVALFMVLLGLLAGASLTLAAFQYDGSQPVNVVRVLALLVGLQLLFLLLTLLLVLAARWPGLRGLKDLLAALNPGAWAASMLSRFARTDAARGLFDWHGRAAAARFAKWQVLVWSQLAAVAFNVAALATAFALVTFTDLAFGWSTTLTVDAARATRIAQTIASPWHGIIPVAVPDAALVEQSRFFRLESGAGRITADSRALTGWWPFTLCAILVYGLLPRLAMLVFTGMRLRGSMRELLLDDPRVTALVDRMRSPAIETEAVRHDERMAARWSPAGGLDRAIDSRAIAIIWERCIDPEAARIEARRRFGSAVETVLEAGGARGLEADRRILDGIGRLGDSSLLVFTPAWEPPVLELLDFLAALRDKVGSAVSIVVVPLPDSERTVTEVERTTWERAVGRLGDPRLYVETGTE